MDVEKEIPCRKCSHPKSEHYDWYPGSCRHDLCMCCIWEPPIPAQQPQAIWSESDCTCYRQESHHAHAMSCLFTGCKYDHHEFCPKNAPRCPKAKCGNPSAHAVFPSYACSHCLAGGCGCLCHARLQAREAIDDTYKLIRKQRDMAIDAEKVMAKKLVETESRVELLLTEAHMTTDLLGRKQDEIARLRTLLDTRVTIGE